MSQEYEELSSERKELQEKGLLPPFFTTAGYQLLKKKYLSEEETALDRYRSVAKTAAQYMPKSKEWEDKFFDVMWKGWLSPATPVLSNMGTDKGCSVSCSGTYVGDSVHEFYEVLKENAILSQNGFGTSAYLGDIRPRGSKFRSDGKASGVLPVVKDYIKMAQNISQGSNRRGSIGLYIEADHKDFWEVADHLFHYPDDANIGWLITPELRTRLNRGDKEAIRIWQRICKIRSVLGRGYLMKTWTANEQRPQMYVDKGLDVKASNLCVAPETLVLTDRGQIPIADLEGETVNVWNGEEFSETKVVKTGENQKLLKVVTDSGQELECTPYHKFYVQDGYGKPPVEKRAYELKSGDRLIKFDLPVIHGEKVLNNAWQNGFFTGDGCTHNGRDLIYLYHEKRELKEHFNFKTYNEQPEVKRICGRVFGYKPKYFVPNEDYTLQSRLDWLAGWLDADGCIYRNGSNEQVVGCSVELNFLKEVQMMLQTCGVDSKIQLLREEGVYQLPANDGTGENKGYNCKTTYRLIINSNGLFKLHQLGINFKRLQTVERKPQRSASHFIKVVDIIDEGRVDDTYCFTEEKRGMGMFNGILTGQCSEIMLYSDQEHTYTCVLSSMNLLYWDEWKDTDAVEVATVFLDCVAEHFIQQGKEIKGLEKAVRFTQKGRALGLGVLGYATYLQENRIPFESVEALLWNNKVFKQIHNQSLKASQWMAKELGEPEWCKGYGVRNTHRTAIAPTMSTSLLVGSISQGIEAISMNVYSQVTAGGTVRRINPSLLKVMEERGVYNKETLKDIEDNAGSVQHVNWLSDHEKEVFKTAFEINQKSVLTAASQRQKWICQSQSLNLFFDANEKEEWISEVLQTFIEDPYLITLYYQRSQSGVKASRSECVACEA